MPSRDVTPESKLPLTILFITVRCTPGSQLLLILTSSLFFFSVHDILPHEPNFSGHQHVVHSSLLKLSKFHIRTTAAVAYTEVMVIIKQKEF